MGIAVDVDFDTMAQSPESVEASKQETGVVTADLKQEVMLGASDCAEDSGEDK